MVPKRRVTIKRVAEEAGVSVQTVSRVINDRPDVADKTRKRVLQIIDRLGFRPSNIARSLIHGRSCTLGVVGYGLEYFGPSRTLSGIEHQANELGYTLLLSLLREPEGEGGIQILHDMVAHHVDGMIWAVPEIGTNRDWMREEISQIPVPIVFLDTQSRPNLPVVNVDNRSGGRLATKHLLDQGYQNIGLIAGPSSWWSAHQRELGWRDALGEAGIAVKDNLIVEGNWSASSGERGLAQLLEQQPRPDAVFACNDQMALGVLKATREMGLKVPDDLAVIGFDDIPEAAFFYPPLSTMRQDLDELGRRAVRELGRLIEATMEGEADAQPETVLLKPELIVRASTSAKNPIAETKEEGGALQIKTQKQREANPE